MEIIWSPPNCNLFFFILFYFIIIRFALRNQVDKANKTALDALAGNLMTFTAIDSSINEQYAKFIKDLSLAPKHLHVKRGAQVMLLRNMQQYGLVNGSRGFVGECHEDTIIVSFLNNGSYKAGNHASISNLYSFVVR